MLDERVSSLERKAEEESRYAESLRSRFGRKSYFNLLKDSLVGVFTPAELDFLGGRDSITYIVFSESIQTELKKGLKSMRALLSEGEKKYLMVQLDEFTVLIRSQARIERYIFPEFLSCPPRLAG